MVTEGHLVEAGRDGAEAFQILLLATGGDGRQRPAVERALERDDAMALGMARATSASAPCGTQSPADKTIRSRLPSTTAVTGELNNLNRGLIEYTRWAK
jgi:hypothetical protein